MIPIPKEAREFLLQHKSALKRSDFEGVLEDLTDEHPETRVFIINLFTELKFDYFKDLKSTAEQEFLDCALPESVNLEKCKYIGPSSFENCHGIKYALSKACIKMEEAAFSGSPSLVMVDMPNCIQVEDYAFSGCENLKTVDLRSCKLIHPHTFQSCENLQTLILDKECVVFGGYSLEYALKYCAFHNNEDNYSGLILDLR